MSVTATMPALAAPPFTDRLPQLVERIDQQSMTPEQADLVRGIVELHEYEISRAMRQALWTPSPWKHREPTSTESE